MKRTRCDARGESMRVEAHGGLTPGTPNRLEAAARMCHGEV